MRLDVWLDVACVFKTRSEAQRACKSGKVVVNEARGKPNRDLHTDDRLEIASRGGRRRVLVVKKLVDTHIPKNEAARLYADVTPPPTPEEVELRDLLRRAGPRHVDTLKRAPDKRERRALRRLKREP